MLVRKTTDLSMPGSRSSQRHLVDLPGANIEEGGYSGIPPTIEAGSVAGNRER